MGSWKAAAGVWLLLGVSLGCGARTDLQAHGRTEGSAGPDPFPCVELPFGAPPVALEVDFVARIHAADVIFLVDVTGSMNEEITQIRDTLREEIVPGLTATVPDVRSSVAAFSDFPVTPYGAQLDQPFRVLQSSTAQVDRVEAAVERLEEQNGGDPPEAQAEALRQIATGEGLGELIPRARCAAGTVGATCLPPSGARIVLLFTDAPFHGGPRGVWPYDSRLLSPMPADFEEAMELVNGIGAKVLGLYSGGADAEPLALVHLAEAARRSGAVSPAGEPIVFDIGSHGEHLDHGVVESVRTLVEDVPLDVDLIVRDGPGDAVDATELVREVVPVAAMPGGDATRTEDGFADVRPGTHLVFRLVLHNERIRAGVGVQRHRLRLVFLGDGVTQLEQRTIEIVVPGQAGGDCSGGA